MDHFCTNCGSPLKPTEKFCRFCGKKNPRPTDESDLKPPDAGIDQRLPCPFCGKALSPDKPFCTSCGKRISDAKPSPPTKNPQIQPKKTEKQTKQPAKKVAKKKLPPKKIWLSATAIILVFSLLLALVIPRQVALSRDVSRQIDQPDQAIFSQGETIAQGAITPEGGMIQSADEKVLRGDVSFVIYSANLISTIIFPRPQYPSIID